MAALRLALFDCDGTLVDSQADICGAMEAAFDAIEKTPPDRHDIRRIVGLSVPQAVAMLAGDLPPSQQQILAQEYKNAYMGMRAKGALQEPLYDGMADLLHALSAAQWQLGVATGKSDRGLHACLTHHGLKELFVTLQTADRHPSKPHPAMAEQAMMEAGVAPSDTVMIGDTSFDMQMARAAGCHAIGVSWGYHESEELRMAGASMIADNMGELKAALEEII